MPRASVARNLVRHACLPLLAAAVLLLWGPTARGESASAPCSRLDLFLSTQIPLPANAPALVMIPPVLNVVRDAGDFMFHLKNGSGGEIALLIEREKDA